MRSRWVPLTLLSLGAAGLFAALVSLSVGEHREDEFEIVGAGEVQKLIAGIEQSGDTLGDPDAELTIDLFTDVQSPHAADYQLEVVDPLIEDYVRTGEARITLRHFPLGPKPITVGGIASEAAGLQDYQWQYAELFMRNLDEAPEAGVDEDFLAAVAAAVPGLDDPVWKEANANSSADSEAAQLAADDEALAAELKLPADIVVTVGGPDGSEQLEGAPSREEIDAAIARVS